MMNTNRCLRLANQIADASQEIQRRAGFVHDPLVREAIRDRTDELKHLIQQLETEIKE